MLFRAARKVLTSSVLRSQYLATVAPLSSHACNTGPQSIYTTKEAHEKNDFVEITKILKESKQQLIDSAAYRGGPNRHALWALRDIHLAMRENYATMISTVGHNIFPVIIASDSEMGFQGVGSTFSLLRKDGTERHIAPTPFDYEMYKAVAHMPLGLFTIVSPYFRTPKGTGWRPKLLGFQNKVHDGVGAIKLCEFSDTTKTHFLSMLKIVDDYINDCLRKNTVNPLDYEKFAAVIYPLVTSSLQTAATLQINHTMPALKLWKQEMGDEWEEIYVLIPTVWPVAGNNPRLQVFEKLMTPGNFKTRVIVTENAKTPDDMRTTLGRVVADRALAQMVFGASTEERAELAFSLSTRRDLITNAADVALQELEDPVTAHYQAIPRVEKS